MKHVSMGGMCKQSLLKLLLFLSIVGCWAEQLRAEVILGEPPRAPIDVSGLPGGGPQAQSVTGWPAIDPADLTLKRQFEGRRWAGNGAGAEIRP